MTRYSRVSAAVFLLLLCSAIAARAETTPDRGCFARALPAEIRDTRLDDAKLLIGWVFDIAAAQQNLVSGAIIDHASGLADVPGFAGATDLGGLTGRYRVMGPRFDAGHGYYGVELGALDAADKIALLFLVNRLFRLPIVFQQPAGVLTDLMTNGALLTGVETQAISDAAAAAALTDAEKLHVPLLMTGQSQAGGVAQLQAGYLAKSSPDRSVMTGFVTLNAAYVVASIRHLGLVPDTIDGINFIKDLDPLFGPYGLLPNWIGLQIFIHPDGTGSARPGPGSAFAASGHPSQHLLSEFNQVSLTKALAATLGTLADHCRHAI